MLNYLYIVVQVCTCIILSFFQREVKFDFKTVTDHTSWK